MWIQLKQDVSIENASWPFAEIVEVVANVNDALSETKVLVSAEKKLNLGPMLLNFFCPQFTNFCYKLECLSLASIASLA